MATKPTGAAKTALEKKAVAAASKSDGMRLLLDAGYSVSEVREVIEAPYGFVYGVARRNGNVNPTPRAAKPAAKAAPAKAAPRAKAAAKGKSKAKAKAKA